MANELDLEKCKEQLESCERCEDIDFETGWYYRWGRKLVDEVKRLRARVGELESLNYTYRRGE